MTGDAADSDEDEKGPYQMSLSYNVLNHLGLNLYSNVPAVLSEAVANAWDADAERVDVEIDPEEEQIEISDNGHGMTEREVNERFLNVGYSRRDDEDRDEVTEKHDRPVMGRKGIGKLSLFSIAEVVEVYTRKDGEDNAFRMVVDDIEEKIESEHETGTDPSSIEDYYPDAIEDFGPFPDDREHGTHIVLTELKKETWQAAKHLRRRLARRFSVIGQEHKFRVFVNGEEITVEDRDYFHKVEYLWKVGDDSDEYEEKAAAEQVHELEGDLNEYVDDLDEDLSVRGWIATASSSGDLDTDSGDINKISILMRGKLAQEDIMDDINNGNVYTAYLFGEIHADFLDDSDKKDAATTNRERIKKTDERYRALREWVDDVVRQIGNKWKEYRTEKGVEEARQFEPIDEWYSELSDSTRERAKDMFGTLNEMAIDDPEEQKQIFTHSVLAFESLRQKESLDKLDEISPENWQVISQVLGEVDEIEATLYHQIVQQRLSVIEKLKQDTEENVLEKVLQEHLYDYPWLLDPAWERATEEKRMERSLTTAFDEMGDEMLTDDEKAGRFDLMLMQTSGKYVLVELKRYSPTYTLSESDLYGQVRKYQKALKKILLKKKGIEEPNIEIICVIGEDLSDWADERDQKSANEAFEQLDARIIRYDQLIEDSYSHYQEFLDEREEEMGRIEGIIETVQESMGDPEETTPSAEGKKATD